MSDYIPQEIEPKWQAKWDADGLYHADIDESRPKHYALTMLPYPSGDLHIGHWYAMTPSDARARFMRMNGFNVLFPMGFDAFGLPAENAAIKDGVHPMKRTYQNIEKMRRQMRTMGTMWDWRREMVSSDPEYYKWTEWFFIQLYKQGLAYRKLSPVDFCPTCNTTLAREQVWGEDRHCERCGTPVIKKDLEQWFFRTTKYADELLSYEGIDWPERVRTLQTNWIGRSEGASVQFKTEFGEAIEVFTTRPDTLWGATFMVLAPENPLVGKLTTAEKKTEIEAYKAQAARQSDIDREAADKEKTGVFTGGYAINPVNGSRVPVWIADYVLMSYGTGHSACRGGRPSARTNIGWGSYGGPLRRTREDDQLRPHGRHLRQRQGPRRRRHAEGHRLAGRAGQWQAGRHLQAARLVDLAPALLGRAHPDGQMR
jgi:leucyl-tRNA synthetase